MIANPDLTNSFADRTGIVEPDIFSIDPSLIEAQQVGAFGNPGTPSKAITEFAFAPETVLNQHQTDQRFVNGVPVGGYAVPVTAPVGGVEIPVGLTVGATVDNPQTVTTQAATAPSADATIGTGDQGSKATTDPANAAGTLASEATQATTSVLNELSTLGGYVTSNGWVLLLVIVALVWLWG